jgi:hypothetical protein
MSVQESIVLTGSGYFVRESGLRTHNSILKSSMKNKYKIQDSSSCSKSSFFIKTMTLDERETIARISRLSGSACSALSVHCVTIISWSRVMIYSI